jgi:high-affinity nickel permease
MMELLHGFVLGLAFATACGVILIGIKAYRLQPRRWRA